LPKPHEENLVVERARLPKFFPCLSEKKLKKVKVTIGWRHPLRQFVAASDREFLWRLVSFRCKVRCEPDVKH